MKLLASAVLILAVSTISNAAAPTTFMNCQRVVLAGVDIAAHRCASSEITCMFTEQGAVSCWK